MAGAGGAVVIAIAESLLGGSAGAGARTAAMFVSLGLLLPIGLFVGVALIALRSALPSGLRPNNLILTLCSSDSPDNAGKLLVHGLSWLVLFPLLYRVIYHFLTAYHHPGLAALSLSLALTALVIISILAIRRLATAAATATRLLGAKHLFLRRPAIALVVVTIAWLAAIVPPLLHGPDATGMFGFVGLLRKDGLGAGPLVSLLALTLVSAVLLWPLLKNKHLALLVVAAMAIVLGVAGPPLAAWIVKRTPSALEVLDSSDGFISVLLKAGRRFSDGDGDGHGTWLGGRDCDDSNQDVYPDAREIPGNGIDEDCSGQDLDLASLKKPSEVKQNAPKKKGLQRPNFPEDVSLLLITIDTLRWDAPGFMGYERKVTPNMDRVAEKGVIYDRAYGLGSYTGQAIPPMLTGKYASELKRTDRHEVRIFREEVFAGELICGDEVHCAGFMSHFLFKPYYGWSQGFDEWTVVGAEPQGAGHIDKKYNSHMVANHTISWLEKPENTSGRFWLWVHFMDPHKEYLEHKGYKKFGNDRRSRYDHELFYTDFHVGRMLDVFYKLPAAKRTVVIISADHGEAFNEHGRWCHGKELWEEIIRVPLAVTGPGIAKKHIARQTSHIDIFPTLLDFFGVPIPEGIHGRSLLPDWLIGQELPEKPVIADQPRNQFYETRRVYIKDGWKLHHLPDTGRYRFYRITDDYERGDSLVETNPDDFSRIKSAYRLFLSTEFKPLKPNRLRK